MRRLMATGLAATLLLGAALPAWAATDTLDQLIQQELTESGPAAPPDSYDFAFLPDSGLVQLEVDLEEGLTVAERFDSFLVTAERATKAQPNDLFALAELGIAYRLSGRPAEAKVTLERAIVLEPAAGPLYDELAQVYGTVKPGITIFVGGQSVSFDVKPVVQNGRTLVPIRAVAERMGANVGWDPATSTATVTLGSKTVQISTITGAALVNGKPVTLDVPATVIDGRVLLPLRFVSENLEHLVTYHPASVTGTAVIQITRPNY